MDKIIFYLYLAVIILGCVYILIQKEKSFINQMSLALAFLYITVSMSTQMYGNAFVASIIYYRWFLVGSVILLCILYKGTKIKINFLYKWLFIGNIFMYLSCLVSPLPKLTLYKAISFSQIMLVILFLDKGIGLSLTKIFWDMVYVYNPLMVCLLSVPYFRESTFLFKGMFGNANSLACTLGVAVPYIYAKSEFEKKGRKFYKALFILVGVVTLLAHSRSVFFGVIVAMLFLIYKVRRENFKRAFAISFIFVALFYILRPSFLGNIKYYALKGKSEITQEVDQAGMWARIYESRRDLVETAKKYFQERPLFGWGYGISAEGSYRLWKGELTLGWGASREKGTSWFAMLEELGIIGSAPIFIAIFLLSRLMLSTELVFHSDKDRMFFYGLCGANIVLLVTSTTESILLAAGSWPFFVFLFNSMCIIKIVSCAGSDSIDK